MQVVNPLWRVAAEKLPRAGRNVPSAFKQTQFAIIILQRSVYEFSAVTVRVCINDIGLIDQHLFRGFDPRNAADIVAGYLRN